jgi:hypothetical protein
VDLLLIAQLLYGLELIVVVRESLPDLPPIQFMLSIGCAAPAGRGLGCTRGYRPWPLWGWEGHGKSSKLALWAHLRGMERDSFQGQRG